MYTLNSLIKDIRVLECYIDSAEPIITDKLKPRDLKIVAAVNGHETYCNGAILILDTMEVINIVRIGAGGKKNDNPAETKQMAMKVFRDLSERVERAQQRIWFTLQDSSAYLREGVVSEKTIN